MTKLRHRQYVVTVRYVFNLKSCSVTVYRYAANTGTVMDIDKHYRDIIAFTSKAVDNTADYRACAVAGAALNAKSASVNDITSFCFSAFKASVAFAAMTSGLT